MPRKASARFHRQMPREVLDLYIEELFGHNGHRKQANAENIDPYTWIDETAESYKFWLSYATIEFSPDTDGIHIHFEGGKNIPPTEEQKAHVKSADLTLLQTYIDWAVPSAYASRWRAHFKDKMIAYFVSPVHFWFFTHYHYPKTRNRRFATPTSPNDLFRHRLLLFPQYLLFSGPLVVPKSIFNAQPGFDVKNPTTESYYLFPNFARWLFEYATRAADEDIGRFAQFYATNEEAWYVGAGTHNATRFAIPDPVIGHLWRWTEVLGMMWGSRGDQGPDRPQWCGLAPPGYHERPDVSAYLDSFGTMAKVWIRTWAETTH